MIKSNSYIELSAADCNVIIKGKNNTDKHVNLTLLIHITDFSPIKINKFGERMFSMTLETKQKNSLDGQIKTKRENIRVKVIDVLFVGLTHQFD